MSYTFIEQIKEIVLSRTANGKAPRYPAWQLVTYGYPGCSHFSAPDPWIPILKKTTTFLSHFVPPNAWFVKLGRS